jgi:hypothetical protein
VAFFPPFLFFSLVLLDFFSSHFWAFRNKGFLKCDKKKTAENFSQPPKKAAAVSDSVTCLCRYKKTLCGAL